MRLKTVGVIATALAVGVLATTVTGGIPGLGQPDTSERRKFTLVANTDVNRGLISVTVKSSARGRIFHTVNSPVSMTWKTNVWAEIGEVLTIKLDVKTTGIHRIGAAPWARCEILRDGDMVDTEVDQNPLVETENHRVEHAHAHCAVTG